MPSLWQLLSPAAFSTAFALGVFTLVGFFSARGQDQLAVADSESAVRAILADWMQDLAHINRDYAWSDEAVLQVTGAVNPTWAKTNFGNVLNQIHDVTVTFIFDSTNRLVLTMPMRTGRTTSPGQLTTTDVFTLYSDELFSLINETRERSSYRPVAASAFIPYAGLPAMIAVTTITPEEGSRLWLMPTSKYVLVFIRVMDPHFLSQLSQAFELPGLRYVVRDESAESAILPIVGRSGEVLKTLTWSPPLPGRALLRRMLPVLVTVILTMVSLFGWSVWRAQRARDVLARQAMILDQIQDAVITVDLKGVITQWNGGAIRMFGYEPEEAIGRTLAFIDPTGMYGANVDRMLAMDPKAGHFEIEGSGKRRNGEIFPILLSLSPSSTRTGVRDGTVGYVLDITLRKQMEAQLEQLATVDALTGARNRRYFADQAPVELERAKRFGHPLSLLFFDLDHFKRVNDRYGHKAGDMVLATFSAICRQNLRASDVFVRHGGEEFVAMLPETDVAGAHVIATRIADQVRQTVFPADPPIRGQTVSIGLSTFRGADDSLEEMMLRIDRAVYRAKELGRDRIEVAA